MTNMSIVLSQYVLIYSVFPVSLSSISFSESALSSRNASTPIPHRPAFRPHLITPQKCPSKNLGGFSSLTRNGEPPSLKPVSPPTPPPGPSLLPPLAHAKSFNGA